MQKCSDRCWCVRANGLADAMVVQVSDELLHARQGLGLGEQLVLPRAHELQVVLRRDGQLQVLDGYEDGDEDEDQHKLVISCGE